MRSSSEQEVKVSSFVKRLRNWFLPEWLKKIESRPPIAFSFGTNTMRLETIHTEFSEVWDSGVAHICDICQSICDIERRAAMMEVDGRVVYVPGGYNEKHTCHFKEMDWHKLLVELRITLDAASDPVEKAKIERTIVNVMSKYEKEIRDHNETYAPKGRKIKK